MILNFRSNSREKCEKFNDPITNRIFQSIFFRRSFFFGQSLFGDSFDKNVAHTFGMPSIIVITVLALYTQEFLIDSTTRTTKNRPASATIQHISHIIIRQMGRKSMT